jgi:hypothetical protein
MFFFHLRDSFDSLDVSHLNRLSEANEPMPEAAEAAVQGERA